MASPSFAGSVRLGTPEPVPTEGAMFSLPPESDGMNKPALLIQMELLIYREFNLLR